MYGRNIKALCAILALALTNCSAFNPLSSSNAVSKTIDADGRRDFLVKIATASLMVGTSSGIVNVQPAQASGGATGEFSFLVCSRWHFVLVDWTSILISSF